jgi:hypothetical protein
MRQPPTAVEEVSPHVPFWFAPTFTQLPLQHELFWKQTSPFCVHQETSAEHFPLRHRFEQHWLLAVQPSPAIRQTPPLIDWQKPPEHDPLQHCALVVHAPAVGASGTHAVVEHFRFEPQLPVQQSDPCPHVSPVVLHGPVSAPQTFGVYAPQIPPPGHAPEPTPHVWRPPQPSGMNPQFWPAHAVA